MEEILSQSFSYASIRILRNYSRLDCDFKWKKKSNNNNTGQPSSTWSYASTPTLDKVYTVRLHGKGVGHKFFYSDDLTKDPLMPEINYKIIELTSPLTNKPFVTTKAKHIKKHYNNPFASIVLYRFERSIKKDGDKIIIKLYMGVKKRNFNNYFFTKSGRGVTITFNTQTGNFLVFEYSKARKSIRKHFFTNSFTSIKKAISSIYDMQNRINQECSSFSECAQEMDDYIFTLSIYKVLGFELNKHSIIYHRPQTILFIRNNANYYKLIRDDIITQWLHKFIEYKKIKLPNDGEHLVSYHYPTEKYLKKNNRKLVAAILDRFKVKSDITIKIVHNNPHASLLTLIKVCRLFGENFPKYIGNIPFTIYTKRSVYDDVYLNSEIQNDVNTTTPILTSLEKENVLKIINDYFINYDKNHITASHNIIDMIYDHFRMITNVKEFFPNTYLRSTTYDTFHNEHIELSRIDLQIKKGYTIDLIFDDKLINEIEKPIEIIRSEKPLPPNQMIEEFISVRPQVFIPKILKTSEEYSEEGSYMHHCVSGYVGHQNSIIVSLRYDNDRVTCEFGVHHKECIQARHFTNNPPPQYFVEALDILKERIKSLPFSIKPLDRVRRRLVINGKEVPEEINPVDFF